MADGYTYQKKRKEFVRKTRLIRGHHTDTKIVGSIAPDVNCKEAFMDRNPNTMVMSNIAMSSVHQVNTERIPTSHKGMKHKEGGWPMAH